MTANPDAIGRGEEAVLEKALNYVTQEPYRSLLADRLAVRRFHMAVSRYQMNVPEALATLALARATSSKKVSALAYAFGYAAIVFPGGSFLVRSGRLRAVRRSLATLFAFSKTSTR
jgi:hypothetical protein